MKLIGVVSSDKIVNKNIETELSAKSGRDLSLSFCEDKDAALEFLNYDMPEIVIMNFSDSGLDIECILEHINSDSWLHTFGIIGIYDRKRHDERELLQSLRAHNIINLIEYNDIKWNLSKTVEILDSNRQIIFHRGLSDRLLGNISGVFEMENDCYAVSCYAGLASICLFNRGFLTQKSKFQIRFALEELILNGVEHGNCGISYAEKSKCLDDGGEIRDLILQKCCDPKIAAKKVRVEYNIGERKACFTITDEGEGFDWKKIIDSNPGDEESLLSLHGRGINATRKFLGKLSYNEKGNSVSFEFDYQEQSEKQVPKGFANEKVITLKPGDVVFSEGENSSFLYYIAYGAFDVYRNNKSVGVITADDIFMGEMSFLLNDTRSATVKAKTEGKLINISRNVFVDTIKQYPHYGIFLSKLLAKKLDNANKNIAK